MRLSSLLFIGPSLATTLPSKPFLHQEALSQADAVKEAFQHAWNGYTKYAFPHDELHPVSNGYGDSRFASLLSFSPCMILTMYCIEMDGALLPLMPSRPRS